MLDAFWGPSYWRNYDPTASSPSYASSSGSASYVNIDTHQYYAFPPLQNLTMSQILTSVCNVSQLLKNTNGLGRTVVGEFSLETGECDHNCQLTSQARV